MLNIRSSCLSHLLQMIMSAVLVLIIVMLMLNVPTLLGASPAPVTKDTVGMGLTVLVRSVVHVKLQQRYTLALSSATDANECSAGTDNCDANAECANTYGSFTCTCNQGYSGNGILCIGESLVLIAKQLHLYNYSNARLA